jgi:hypothetical protein
VTPAPAPSAGSNVVGASGGSVASSDGKLKVDVPPGALGGDVTLTIAPTTASASGSVGAVYDIGPSGTQFKVPVTMTFSYAGVDLAGHNPSELLAGTLVDGKWQALAGSAVDTTSSTVHGTTTHLSIYGAFVNAASSGVCVDVSSGYTCPSGGGGSCTSTLTCANPRSPSGTLPCDAYPGSTQTACKDGAQSITATCCFPPDVATCFEMNSGCSAVSGGTCTPPSCGDICSHSGATVKSCTPGTSTNTAVCCLPAGTALPGSGGSSAADGGTISTVPDSGTTPGGGGGGGSIDSGTSNVPDSGSGGGGPGGGSDGGVVVPDGGGGGGGSCTPEGACTIGNQVPGTLYTCTGGAHPGGNCMIAGDGGTLLCCSPPTG